MKAQAIEHDNRYPLVEYNISDAAIARMREKYTGLAITDPASYKTVSTALTKVRTTRTAIEKRRKELKADALEWGRRVDAEAKRLTALLLPIEEELKQTKQAEDERRAEEKAAKERAEKERIEKIVARLFELQSIPQSLAGKTSIELQRLLAETRQIQLTEEVFEEYLPKAERLHALAIEQIEQAIEAALIAEQEEAKRQAEELRRKEEEERRRQEEAEREAKEKAERAAEIARFEALKKEQEEARRALQAQQRKIEERARDLEARERDIEAEKRRIEEAKKTEEERIAREEAERKAAEEARARAEQQAKEAAERAEQQRIEQQRLQAEAEARARELRPDAEKLLAFANGLEVIENLDLKSDGASWIYTEACQALHDLAAEIRRKVRLLTTTYIEI